MKITDVPYSDPSKQRNYRSYKLQFQAPQTVGFYTWKVYLVSDTFVGEEIVRDVVVRVVIISFAIRFSDDRAAANRRCIGITSR